MSGGPTSYMHGNQLTIWCSGEALELEDLVLPSAPSPASITRPNGADFAWHGMHAPPPLTRRLCMHACVHVLPPCIGRACMHAPPPCIGRHCMHAPPPCIGRLGWALHGVRPKPRWHLTLSPNA